MQNKDDGDVYELTHKKGFPKKQRLAHNAQETKKDVKCDAIIYTA